MRLSSSPISLRINADLVIHSVAMSMRRSPQVQWSAYMARCCRTIREAGEFATDSSLIAFVRMQHITDRLRSLFPIYDRDEDTPAPFFKEHYSAIFSSVRKEMEDLQKEEPAINKDNRKCSFSNAGNICLPDSSAQRLFGVTI